MKNEKLLQSMQNTIDGLDKENSYYSIANMKLENNNNELIKTIQLLKKEIATLKIDVSDLEETNNFNYKKAIEYNKLKIVLKKVLE